MKKLTKSVLMFLAISVLVSCGSSESSEKEEKREHSEALKERNIHINEFLKKQDSIQPLFDDPDFEPYHKALMENYEWDRLWKVEFDKKYPNYIHKDPFKKMYLDEKYPNPFKKK